MTYRTSVKIPYSEFKRINSLLSLSDLEIMTDQELKEYGAKVNSSEGIFEAFFNDGCRLTYDLCSGNNNYFDDMVFYDRKNNANVVECDFELGEEIEIKDEDNTYIVDIIIVWE